VESAGTAPSIDLRLAGVFRGRPAEPASADDATLGAALRRLFEEGGRAWPGLDVTPDTFVLHLAARAGAGPSGAPLPPVERAADLYLTCACAAQARGAIEAFERAHLGVVGAYLARMRPSPAFVDEVRQQMREKLFVGRDGGRPKITEYDGRGSLASWVRVVALRAAIDLRRQTPDAAPPTPRAEEEAGGDPETGYLKQRYRQAFNEAFRGAVAALGGDQRELLRLHFVDGLTLDHLAARAGVHRATIARRIAAAREAVAEEARRLLEAALGASDSELESLAAVMRSQIDVSLPGLL
jgi:RNA polymerase sigma-70 factor (ECF subfamily)